jgi:ribosomal protein L23
MGKTEKTAILFILLLSSNLFLNNARSEEDNLLAQVQNSSQPSGWVFTPIYIDGMSANSSGFKIILSPYERRIGEGLFNPSIVDVKFGILNNKDIIFTDTLEQVTLYQPAELSGRWKTILKEGTNYTAFAQVFMYENGKPTYISTSYSGFTSVNDAKIINVDADGLGSSITVESISMVPLDARVSFVLKQNDKILEEKEIDAPVITSNDADETIEVLWNRNLDNGKYIAETKIVDKKNEIIDRYDKVFEVKTTAVNTSVTAQSTGDAKKIPGFQGIEIIVLTLIINLWRRLR